MTSGAEPVVPQRWPDLVCAALRSVMAAHPDQRVMQVVVNALGTDPFYVEDAEAIERLHEYAAKGRAAG